MRSEPPPRDEAEPAPPSDAADPMLGAVVGDKWRVLRVLGRGGMGVVYEGQNVAIGKRVALKFIEADVAQDADIVQRFRREAEAASAVESAHIVHVFDTGVTAEGAPYLVMELLSGETLGARIRVQGKLSVSESVRLVGQVLRGLARAHTAGVIHRDLKPENVFLVERDDDEPFVKILDFGVSKIARRADDAGGGTLTRKGTVIGTPYYMSPEQAQADATIDGRTDLFSVGAILYECLTGHPPHHEVKSYEAIIVAICTRDPADLRTQNAEVGEALAEVVRRALARDRATRFSSAGEFLEALRAAVPGAIPQRTSLDPADRAPTSTPPTSGAPGGRTNSSWSTRREGGPSTSNARTNVRRLVAAAVAIAAIAFAATFVFVRGRGAHVTHDEATGLAGEGTMTLAVVPTPASARVLIDHQPAPDRLVRGPGLSAHAVRVEAEGFEPFESNERLDGRQVLHVDLAPALTPSAAPALPVASSPPAPSSPRPTRPGTNGRGPTNPGVAPGLHLKTEDR